MIPIEFDNPTIGKLKVMIPFIDSWRPETPQEEIVKWQAKDVLIMPIRQVVNIPSDDKSLLDFFYLSKKRGYRVDKIRLHTSLYLNYFFKYFDPELELLTIYGTVKYLIDTQNSYSKENLFNDIIRYILGPGIRWKVRSLVDYNYNLNLKAYSNKNQGLQYNDNHGRVLMEISMLFNIVYPLLVHYLYEKDIDEADDFLLEMYDIILDMYNMDIYNKLYETSYSNIKNHSNVHKGLWIKQDIRGKNVTTHTLYTVQNIILNGIIKYVFNKSLVNYNLSIISGSNDFQIVDINYELDYRPKSSTDGKENGNEDTAQSSFDKWENYQTKENEALFIQNTVNCKYTMDQLRKQFGPIDKEEIQFYINRLTVDGQFQIVEFQKTFLIFNLFYKYFGDTISINPINRDDYVELMIIGKRILQSANLVILPYIFSAKVNKIVRRKMLNKKELLKIKSSKFYKPIVDKYKNNKIEDLIIEMIASILSSEFEIIEYKDTHNIDRKILDTSITDMLVEEVLMFVTLI